MVSYKAGINVDDDGSPIIDGVIVDDAGSGLWLPVVMKDGKVVFALTGEGGEFDHAEIIKAFVAGGYAGDFCCEVSSQIWKAKGYDAVAATKTCFKNLAAAFQRAGVVQRR